MKKIIINFKTILISVLILCILFVVFIKNAGSTHKSYFMMDTYVTIDANGFHSKKAVDEAYVRLKEIEDKMNSHTLTSKVSQKVFDDDLLYVLKKGLYYGSVSNGLFDITIKPLTSLWNITSDTPRVPSDEEISKAKENVNYKEIVIQNGTVKIPDSFEIDLGGIAKGYAADEAVKILKSYGINDAVINLGGNVYVLGAKRIGVQNPLMQNGEYMGILSLSDCSVATSGGYERNFTENGVLYHHIIDPYTGYPKKTDLLSATVISSSSVDADCLATILFMSGTVDAIKLAKQLNVQYVLIDENLKVYCSENIKFEITNDSFEVK